MEYKYLNSSLERENLILPESAVINSFLLKNHNAEIIKAINFLDDDEKFLHVHGFIGTGKRQFVNYISEFLNQDVVKLEYYCKEATVCDDILLSFTETIENLSEIKSVSINAKITTLGVKFKQQICGMHRPFLIILHSSDNITEENIKIVSSVFSDIARQENVKLIITTKAMEQNIILDLEEDRKIFLKALSKDIFKGYLLSNGVECSDKQIEDLYEHTRGYYYYTALAVKVLQAMKISLGDLLQKIKQAEITFDSFIGLTYINLIPTAIRNFFWFLKTVRHGMSLNALAVLDLYDEFSIEYLKTNLIIFQAGEMLYVQDYFVNNVEVMIPEKTQIRLHKYIIGIYESQLKEPIKSRVLLMSRQALRAEIDYHGRCIEQIEKGANAASATEEVSETDNDDRENNVSEEKDESVASTLELAEKLCSEKKFTEAIELLNEVVNREDINISSLTDLRLNLARLYKQTAQYKYAEHYYELVETYYKKNKEIINLNYLYYEMTDLYYLMYKHQRAIDTVKKVIYSIDTPQSLMVSSCMLLGNIYYDMENYEESYTYYKKALESLDDGVEPAILAELYFKYALSCDEKGDINSSFDYYNKCITVSGENNYRALAYSNLAACYIDTQNIEEALRCYIKAYEIEKENNNYEGIYFTSSNIANLYSETEPDKSLSYLIEAKKSAEFINENMYMMESSIALGDYYYNMSDKYTECLSEYFNALRLAEISPEEVDISKIKSRINDMKLRMQAEDYEKIEKKYAK